MFTLHALDSLSEYEFSEEELWSILGPVGERVFEIEEDKEAVLVHFFSIVGQECVFILPRKEEACRFVIKKLHEVTAHPHAA